MTIKVESTSYNAEPVKPANESEVASKAAVEVEKPASSESDSQESEKVEASDASENENENEVDSKDEEKDEESKDDVEAKGESKPKKGFEKRIKKLVGKLSAKDQEIEYLKKELFNKAQVKENSSQDSQKVETKVEGKPNPDNFDSHADYVEALTDWKLEQRETQRELKQRETQVRTEFQKQVESHNTRVKEFQKSHSDFMDVIESVDDIPMSHGLQDVIVQSDMGPALMYELCNNRAEYERINALGIVAAAREIGKIEARLSKSEESTNKKETKSTTKAPPPISPVGNKNSGTVRKSISDPNLSQREYETLRAEQMKARGA